MANHFTGSSYQLPYTPDRPDASVLCTNFGCETQAADSSRVSTVVPSISDRSAILKKLAVQSSISKAQPKSRLSTSRFKGVTRHSTTGRYEAHLWDSTFIRVKSNKGGRARGKQIYLGGFKSEQQAARAYDLASLKYWGLDTDTNFPVVSYSEEMAANATLSRREVVAKLKRSSNGFSRGQSQYRGVTRHHKQGRWEARIGRASGSKYMYLGTYPSQEAAAAAYDEAAVKYRGSKAVTNFASGSRKVKTDSSADNSSALFTANSSTSDHATAGLQDVADSSLSAQSVVAVNDAFADSLYTCNLQQMTSAHQPQCTPPLPLTSWQPAASQPKHVNPLVYQQADMFFGASVPVAPCYESPDYEWGYACMQPCSSAADSNASDDFVALMKLVMGQDETSSLACDEDDMLASIVWDA